MAVSFEMGKVGPVPATDEDQEFNASTLFGVDQVIYTTMLRLVENQDETDIPDAELLNRLSAHIDRGVRALSVRVKSPSDIAKLLAGEMRI